MAVAPTSAMTAVFITIIAVVPIMVTAVPIPAVVAVAVAIVTHEVHGLAACTVLSAVARPILGVPWRHAHVDRTLVHGDRLLLDDDGLRVDQGWLLITDVHAAIEAGLGDADAHANIG